MYEAFDTYVELEYNSLEIDYYDSRVDIYLTQTQYGQININATQ